MATKETAVEVKQVPAFLGLKLVYGGSHAALWARFSDNQQDFEVNIGECNNTGAPSPVYVSKERLAQLIASGGKE